MISVKSLAEARQEWHGFDGVLTIEDVGFEDGLRVGNDQLRQIVFQFDDTDHVGGPAVAPEIEQIRQAIEYGRHFEGKNLLINCHQGQCRSAAVALAIIADRLGVGREEDAVARLIEIRPSSVCNLVVLEHADTLLERRGVLRDAWMAYEDTNRKAAGIRLLRSLAHQQNIEG